MTQTEFKLEKWRRWMVCL